MIKVSVIIPVYNAEKYIADCLNSLVKQTYQDDIEIVVVNDGSTDSSVKVIENYRKCLPELKLISISNTGSSIARKIGVENATGEYICFLDSDDLFEPNFIETMVHEMESKKLDMAECSNWEFTDKSTELCARFQQSFILETQEEFFDKIIRTTILNGKEAVVMWNKCYRKELILKYVTDFGQNALEDYLFNMLYYQGVKRYSFIAEPLYRYRITPNSLSRSFNQKLFDILLDIQKIKEQVYNWKSLNKEDKSRCVTWFLKYLRTIIKQIFLYEKDKSYIRNYLKEICNSEKVQDLLKIDTNLNYISKNIKQKNTKKLFIIGKIYSTLYKFKMRILQ